MNKLKKMILLACLILMGMTMCACSYTNPIAEEYRNETCIVIENMVTDCLISIGMTRYIEDVAIGSTGMANADGSIIEEEYIPFAFCEEDFPAGSELEKFAIQVSVTEEDGTTYELDKLYIPYEFGKDIFIELTYKDGTYLVRETQ